MKSAYIDSLQIHSNNSNIGYFLQPSIEGLEQPEIRLPSFDRPGVDGAVVPNQLYGGRIITMRGFILADTISDYRTRRLAFESAVNIKRDINGNLSPIYFKFTTMDDLDLQVECYTRKFDLPDEMLVSGKYKLELFSPSIYIFSQTLKSSILYPFDGGGMAIAMGIPMAMNANATANNNLVNSGNIDAYPIITINGAITNPTISNDNNGDSFTITKTLTAGQYVVVDTFNRTVMYYSSLGATPTNIRDLFSGDFLRLSSGNNNVKLTLGSFTTDGNAQFNWRDSYSGI